MNYDYGNWLFVLFNIVLFLYFIKVAFRPRTKTDWTTFRSFGAFIVALFAEMYGFPLTIYLLTSYFGNNFLGLDFTHNSGHLLNDLLGLKGDPHFSLIHIFSNVFIIGFLLQWPTLVTLIMAPILVVRYVALARSEEEQMVDKFGRTYRVYRNKTPGFFPSPTLVVKDMIQKIRNSNKHNVIIPNK